MDVWEFTETVFVFRRENGEMREMYGKKRWELKIQRLKNAFVNVDSSLSSFSLFSIIVAAIVVVDVVVVVVGAAAFFF